MEHLKKTIINRLSLVEREETAEKLLLFGKMIQSDNSKFNLTGHKNVEDIIINLIIDSLSPLKIKDVPRGTSAADIGTGAGIPGIPLAISYPDITFTLFDSNSKKIRFIEYAISELAIRNASALCARAEEVSREKVYRECFDIVFSRAMSDVFIAGELCSPFVKPGGCIYLYISEKQKDLTSPVLEHLGKLSLEISPDAKQENQVYIKHSSGLLLKKISPIADTYPRRISAIKRGAAEIEKKHN